MTENFTIRALTQEDWQAFKAMRLEALKAHEGVFGSYYAIEAEYPDEHWLETLDGERKQVFGAFDKGQLIGLSAVFTYRNDPAGKTALCAMWYMRESYRGTGLFNRMVQKSVEWAKAQPQFETIITGHRDGNEASRRANQKAGFVFTHKEMRTWPDGLDADEYFYEIRIK